MADMEGVFLRMRVLVTGADGQLGKAVVEVLGRRGHEIIPTNKRNMDITDERAVEDIFSQRDMDAVIHCAAYTNVEKAEEERELCGKINIDGTRNIARSCERKKIKMVYISTDYVFDGEGPPPYCIATQKNPLNMYGWSKHMGEEIVQEEVEKYFIVRTSWIFGNSENDFVKKMCRLAKEGKTLKVVNDQFGKPTYAWDLAEVIVDLLEAEKYGIYHVANDGDCTWYEFAKEIFKQLEKDIDVLPVSSEEFLQKAKRPIDSRLKCSVILPHWKDRLRRYLGGRK